MAVERSIWELRIGGGRSSLDRGRGTTSRRERDGEPEDEEGEDGEPTETRGPVDWPESFQRTGSNTICKGPFEQGERMGRITKTLASILIPSPHPCTRASGSCFPRLRGRAAAARARPDIERRRRRRRRRHGASSVHSPESSLPRGDAGRRRPDLVPEGVGSCGGGEGSQRGRSRRPEEEQTEAGGRAQGGRRGSTRRPAGLRWAARLSERPEERRSFADSSAARR